MNTFIQQGWIKSDSTDMLLENISILNYVVIFYSSNNPEKGITAPPPKKNKTKIKAAQLFPTLIIKKFMNDF